MRPTAILLFLLILCLHVSSQQKEYIFKNFTQEEGLPSNEAYYVFEDSRHFLWFATDLGVVRYNGSKFEQFNLPDNVVFKIKEDSKGRIWFFSHKAQLAYFENERIHIYKYNDYISRRIPKINIIEAYIDGEDNIRLNSSVDSNYLINNNGKTTAESSLDVVRTLAKFEITYKNSVPVVEKAKVCVIIDTFSFELKSIKKTINFPIKSGSISHYGGIVDNKGTLFFFAGKILFAINKEGKSKVKYFPNDILCLENHSESLWVGMIKTGGILLNKAQFDIIGDTILLNKSVTSIKTDQEGGIWVSTLENGVYYAKNLKITNCVADNNSDKKISRLAIPKDGALMYTNAKGIYEMDDKKATNLILNLPNNNISDIIFENPFIYVLGGFQNTGVSKTANFSYKKFKLLIGINSPAEGLIIRKDSFIYSRSASVVKFTSNKIRYPGNLVDSNFSIYAKTLLNKPSKLFIAKNDFIWAANNNGIFISDNLYDTFTQIKPSNKLLEKGVTCVKQMDNNLMVLGIRFGGVLVLNDTNILVNITEKDGLLSDKIRYLLPIKDQLWVATAKGISVIKFTSYNPIKFNIINIGKNDGFYNVTINQLIQFKGDIVAATSNGLYFIKDPDELINRKPIPIPFYINSISYYQNDTSTLQSLDLPYSKSRVLLRYAAVSLNSAEEIKYQYTFSSSDTGWTTTTSTDLLLENLEPGDYDLKIKAVIPNQNRASEVKHFHITVEKPWWQKNWFRSSVILAFITAGIFFTRYRIKKVQAEEERKTELSSKIAELEQTALRAQMNPHFIFNCLTSIQQLIVSGDKTEANEYLVKFARLIRKTLDLSANPFISIKEEMEYLGEYMFLEQLRITGRFEYIIETEEPIEPKKILIPNMMIQPVVENCIRHGIKSLEQKKGLIKVHFRMNGKQLICSVNDNGIGRIKSSNKSTELVKHKSYGIEIIEKRLKVFGELNDEQMGIEIKDLFNDDGTAAGTEVILQLPYKTTV